MNIRELKDRLCTKLSEVVRSVCFAFFPAYRKRTCLAMWTKALLQNASVYTGMYAGVFRAAKGQLSKPERLLNEWYVRTKYKFEGQPVDVLCRKLLLPSIEKSNPEQMKEWATILLTAARRAGIICEDQKEIVLNDNNVMAYIEWDGNEMYVDDIVEVIYPAWYQNGRIIEQGHCRLKK